MKFGDYIGSKLEEGMLGKDWGFFTFVFFTSILLGTLIGLVLVDSDSDSNHRHTHWHSHNPSEPSSVKYPSGSHSQHPASHYNASGLLEGAKCKCQQASGEQP